MPTLNDWDKSDEDAGGLSEGLTPAQSSSVGSSNGPKQATPTKQEDSGFVPWSSFVSANQDVSQREAGKLSSQVQGDVTKAQGDLSNAQQGFNNGIASNYSTPGQAGSTTGSKSSSKSQAGAEQNTAPATSATDSWAGFSAPSTPAAQRTPTPTKGAPTGTAIDGSNPFASPQSPQSRTPTPTNPVQSSPVTSQSPSAATPAQQPVQQQPSFGGSVAMSGPQIAPAAKSTTPPPGQSAQNLLTSQRAHQLGANAAANGAQGPHDLESATGQAGWGQLLGDTTKAQQEANALGSETGVQGLLQRNAATPTNSAFDAALINGQGGPQFRDLANKYGGNQLGQNIVKAEQASQDKWNQLAGDVSTRQAFDKAAKGAYAIPGTQASAALASQQSTNATLGITQTSGANGQFDPSGFPPNFDPSSDPNYQSAATALAKAAPVPSWADNAQDLLSSQQATNVWPTWAKELGMTEDQLTNLVKSMPDWQFQLFIRGVVPAGIDRSNGTGYFEGLNPVNVQATGAGTDPKYKAFQDAMQVYESAVLAAAGPVGGGFGAAQNAVTQANAKKPQNTDPLGGRG